MNVTLSVDEQLLARARKKAGAAGKIFLYEWARDS
jgi:hypothetical protein